MKYSADKQKENGQNPSIARQMLNKVPEITMFFWIIKILTTTVGETSADFLNDNLGLGTIGTSPIFLITILGLVMYLTKTKIDSPSIVEG
ncbi:hypothetical protein V7137_29635 [Neobacillus drentensis]